MTTCFLVGNLVCFQLILWLRRDKKARLNKIFEDIRDIPRKKKHADPSSQTEGKLTVLNPSVGAALPFEYLLMRKLAAKQKT